MCNRHTKYSIVIVFVYTHTDITNICTISWNCKNRSNCNAALLSCRVNPDTDGSDYNVTRVQNRAHTGLQVYYNEEESTLNV